MDTDLHIQIHTCKCLMKKENSFQCFHRGTDLDARNKSLFLAHLYSLCWDCSIICLILFSKMTFFITIYWLNKPLSTNAYHQTFQRICWELLFFIIIYMAAHIQYDINALLSLCLFNNISIHELNHVWAQPSKGNCKLHLQFQLFIFS